MSIVDGLKAMIGKVTIEKTQNGYLVSGIAAWKLERAIHQTWGSSKISSNLIKLRNNHSFTVMSFFVLELIYCLERMSQERFVRYFNRQEANAVLHLLKTKTWAASIEEKHPDILDFKQLDKFVNTLTPKPHQLEYLKLYNEIVPKYHLRGHLLSAGVGVGKTLNSIYLMECLKVDTVICIIPLNSVDRVWNDTLRSCFKVPVKYWVTSMGGTAPAGCKYYGFHYEQLQQAVDFAKSNRGLGRVGIIVDECHHFNDMKSQRTNLFLDLVRITGAQHTLFMSGTPIKAMAVETVPLMRTIDPMFMPSVEERYLTIFGKSTIRALDILNNRLGFVSHRIKKDDIVTYKEHFWDIAVQLKNGNEYTLPSVREKMRAFVAERVKYYAENKEKYENDYYGALEVFELWLKNNKAFTEDYKIYQRNIKVITRGYEPATMGKISAWCNKFEKEIILPTLPPSNRAAFRKAKSVVKYVNFTILGEALGTVLGKLRVQCNVDIATNLYDVIIKNRQDPKQTFVTSFPELIEDAEKKTILFTNFVEVVDELAKHLAGKGFTSLRVHGETNKDLPKIIKDFYENPKYNPLIATFQSLSSAVPIICANRVIMLNLPYRPHDYEQAKGRAARMGQDKDVDIIDVTLDTGEEPNISTRSKDIMQWALENVQVMLGDKKLTLGVSEGVGGHTWSMLNPDWKRVEHAIDSTTDTEVVTDIITECLFDAAAAINNQIKPKSSLLSW